MDKSRGIPTAGCTGTSCVRDFQLSLISYCYHISTFNVFVGYNEYPGVLKNQIILENALFHNNNFL